ncbi:MAG: hypothetical protein LBG10_07900 [Treponema sp.]|jgi:hypothetical protein|nr:hypothetical protein [Treponema sp.]
MKKRLFGLYKTAAAVAVLGMGLLLLVSCNNIFAPPQEARAAGEGQTGAVALSLGNGVEGARTLLPTAVSFQLYKLTITPASGSVQYVDVNSASPPAIALAAGTWNIHVDAYTDALGNNKAAEGDSGTFTVNVNQTTPVSITLRAVTAAGTGTLSVDISGEGGVIQDGYLQIYNGTDFNDLVTFYNGSYDTTNAYIDSSGLDMDISLPAGQYRVWAYIYNNEGQAAHINEVAYIYSNLTTGLVQVIGAGDFTDITTISGTVQYQENGMDQYNYLLGVFMNPDGTGNYLNGTDIYYTGAQSYTLSVPRPDKNVTLYLYIYKNGNWFYADSLNLTSGQPTATKNILLNRSTITLSGSVSITVGGNTLDYVHVYADTEGGGSSYDAAVENDGTWTMTIPDDFSGTLRFSISTWDSSGLGYSASNVGSWTPGSSTTGINLTASLVVISGSFTATENGNPLSGGYVYVSAYKETVTGSGNFDVYVEGQSNDDWAGGTCTWTFTTAALSPAADVQIRINNIGNNQNTATETITLGTSNVTIPLRAYTFSSITLGGSIGTVTVNGNTPSNVQIYARTSDGSFSRWGSVSGGFWQISGIPNDFNGTLTIGVEVDYAGWWYEKDVTTWNSSSSTTINLEAVDFTLSPMGGTVTTNGTSALAEGWLYVVGQPASALSDLYGQTPLASAEITGGSFSGYVLSNLTSGYVVIFDDTNNVYITPSPVTLNTSMSLNLSAMTLVIDDF